MNRPVIASLAILIVAFTLGCGSSDNGGEPPKEIGPTANADPAAVDELRRWRGFTEHALGPTQAAIVKCARLVQASAEPDPVNLSFCQTDVISADGIFGAMAGVDAAIRDVAPKAAPACRASLLLVERLDARHDSLLNRIIDIPYAQRSRWSTLSVANARLTRTHRVALRRARTTCAL
jgi:hypothetical protein